MREVAFRARFARKCMHRIAAVMLAICLNVWPCSVRATEPDDPVHRAITLWLEERPDEALREVESRVLAPYDKPGRGHLQSAALRNVGARLHFDRYQRLKGQAGNVKEAFRALESAKAFAAAAVWEAPFDAEYWRDFIRIGAVDPKRGTMEIAPFIAQFTTKPYAFRVEGHNGTG
jgi:hypothetical protein